MPTLISNDDNDQVLSKPPKRNYLKVSDFNDEDSSLNSSKSGDLEEIPEGSSLTDKSYDNQMKAYIEMLF